MMEPWQKLVQALCEIWAEEDLKAGKVDDEKRTENSNNNKGSCKSEDYYAAA